MAKEEDFVRTISAFSGVAGRRIDFVMRKIGLDAFNQLMRRSPVDTGRFRASWRYSVNKIDDSVAPETKRDNDAPPTTSKGAPPSGAQLTQVIAANKTVTRKSVIHISNSLPYAIYLERGHSPQAPNGIVGPTFLKIRLGIIKAVAEARKAVPDAR